MPRGAQSGLTSIDVADWSGGINTAVNPYKLAKNQVWRAENLLLQMNGSLTVRPGSSLADTAPAGTTDVLALYQFVHANGTLDPLAIVRFNDNTDRLYNRKTLPWTLLFTFTTLNNTPKIVAWLDKAIIAHGYELLVQTDGTAGGTSTIATGPPGAQWLVLHQNALWAWNTAAATSGIDGPNSLRQSDINSITSWPNTFQLFINRDDSDTGTGLGVFTIAEAGITPTNVLVAFKNFATYQINGLFTSTAAPTITRAQTDMGCVAGRSVQFLPSVGLVRLTHRGFGVFNGLNDQLLSETLRIYLFGGDQIYGGTDVSGIAWDVSQLSTSAQSNDPPIYLCACPLNTDNTSTRLFVYDLTTQAWTTCTYPSAFASIQTLYQPGIPPFILAGKKGTGDVWNIFQRTDLEDIGNAQVTWSVTFPPLGSPLRWYYYRRLQLKLGLVLTNIGSPVSLTGTFTTGPVQIQDTLTYTLTVPVYTLATVYAQDVTFDIGRLGEGLLAQFTGQGHVSIQGLAVHVAPKPLTRARV
jgi:hypothetical protein